MENDIKDPLPHPDHKNPQENLTGWDIFTEVARY